MMRNPNRKEVYRVRRPKIIRKYRELLCQCQYGVFIESSYSSMIEDDKKIPADYMLYPVIAMGAYNYVLVDDIHRKYNKKNIKGYVVFKDPILFPKRKDNIQPFEYYVMFSNQYSYMNSEVQTGDILVQRLYTD